VGELLEFGKVVLLVAAGFSLALASTELSGRFPLPRPAIFLFAAALASDLFPSLTEHVSIREVERIGVVALIMILFDGGMHVGWRRLRASALEIASLGLVGTFATAGLMALAAHWLFGFSWIAAGILGAALAPTDPAVTFSVLGNREVGGRTGTILEGESGVNDPVGIALMVGMLELARRHDASFVIVLREFSIEMALGLAIGLVGATLLLPLLHRPLRTRGSIRYERSPPPAPSTALQRSRTARASSQSLSLDSSSATPAPPTKQRSNASTTRSPTWPRSWSSSPSDSPSTSLISVHTIFGSTASCSL
jgi:NhaP-type Na+/H+ or K+/H+ antiporter